MQEKPALLQRLYKTLIKNPDYKAFTLEDPSRKIDGFTVAEIFGGTGKSAAGQDVNEQIALTFSAVWACVRAYSAPFSYFPINLYSGTRTNRTRIDRDPFLNAINQPRPYMTRNVMMERAMIHVILWGNAYIEPLMNKRQLYGFYIHHPSTVAVKISGYGESERVVYEITPPNTEAKTRVVGADKMLHIPGLGDEIVGKGVIKYAREDIGLELARRQYGADFFEKGGRTTGLLSFKGLLKPDQKEQAKEAHLKSRREGGDLILGAEADYTPFSISPEDAQFLQTGFFSVNTIARWFGVPPWKIQDLQQGSTFRNIEEMGIAFLKDSMAPIVEKFETEFNNKIFGLESDRWIEFDMEAYLRADAQAVAEQNRTGIQNGYKKINEVRAKNGDNPIEGGDRAFIQSNMIPVDKIDEMLDKPEMQQAVAQALADKLVK